MKTLPENQTKLYQALGKLFYGVAAVDKTVAKEEIVELKKIVKEHWLYLEDSMDEYGSDAAYQIEIVFDWLNNQSLKSEECFNDFRFFFKEHSHLFNDKTNALIMKTAYSIASAFAGKNKSELTMITQLKFILEGKH